MVKYIFVAFFITSLGVFNSLAQQAFPINQADSMGVSLEELDSLYQSGIHSDASKAVFGEQQEEYIAAYYSMLHELSTYLNQNDFKWGGQIRCFNRIYFAEDGKIDYFLYNFKAGEISPEQEASFQALLSKFIENYKFSLSNNKKFAQCSPVNYRDAI